ncbi:MAG TPA: DUF192 domain-containing protein [Tepidisphaeraceae bacterium]
MSRPARTKSLAVAWSLLLTAGCHAEPPAPTSQPQPQALPTVTITLGNASVTLQVADDDAEREKGLMYTRQMPADRGMIFVFPVERPLAFWMKNTPIDLDIVYADHAGRIVAIKTMRAYDLSSAPSEEPATYAIELNAGVAAKLNLAVGQKLALPPELMASVK